MSNIPKVLVFGATGRVGGLVLKQLEGAQPRLVEPVAAVRNLAKAAHIKSSKVGADLSDPASLQRAAAETGATKAFIYAVGDHGMNDEIEALIKGGIKHIVFLSSGTVDDQYKHHRYNTQISRKHATVEDSIMNSRVTYTMVRGGYFASNTMRWKSRYLNGEKVFQPYANLGVAINSEEDLAAMSVLALTTSQLDNQGVTVYGPELLTFVDQVRIIATVTGIPIQIIEISPEQFKEDVKTFIPEPIIDSLLYHFKAYTEEPEEYKKSNEIFKKHLGRLPMSFEEYVKLHKDEFTA